MADLPDYVNGIPKRKYLFKLDRELMDWCDAILFLCDGRVPDEGASFEPGYCFAKGKRCIGYIRNKSGKVAFMDNYSDSELKEKLLNREVIYDGKYPLWMDELQMPDGRIIKREHLHHPGGVAILAADDSGKIAFVKQYRYPIEQVTEEIPAGKLDKIPDEDPIHAANRELREETGFTASEIIPMGYIYPSPGVSDEILHLFFARSLVRSQQELDDDEFINVEWIPIDEIERRIVSGEMSDTKGIVAFARAKFSGLI